MVLSSGAFKRQLDPKDGALMIGNSAFIEENPPLFALSPTWGYSGMTIFSEPGALIRYQVCLWL